MTQYGNSADDTWRDNWEQLIGDLARYAKENRAERGYNYYRSGAVRDVECTVSSVFAKVVSSSGGFYLVTVQIRPFAAGVWNHFFNMLSLHGELSNVLLHGELPAGIETLFTELGVRLLPAATEVDVSCDCPDSASPCKHVFALLFHLLEEIELNPLRLVLLRGMPESIWFERIGQSTARSKHTLTSPGQSVPGATAPRFVPVGAAADMPFPQLPWIRSPGEEGVDALEHRVLQSSPPAALKPVQALWHRAKDNTYWYGSAPAEEEGRQLENWHPLNISVFQDARSQFAVHRFGKPPFSLPRQDAMTELRDVYRQVSEEAAAILREELDGKIMGHDE